jgi:hypothetical protein
MALLWRRDSLVLRAERGNKPAAQLQEDMNKVMGQLDIYKDKKGKVHLVEVSGPSPDFSYDVKEQFGNWHTIKDGPVDKNGNQAWSRVWIYQKH